MKNRVRASLKIVQKITPKQKASAPDLTGIITIDNKTYDVAVYVGDEGSNFLYLTEK